MIILHNKITFFVQTYPSQRQRVQPPGGEAAADRDPSHAAAVERASFPGLCHSEASLEPRVLSTHQAPALQLTLFFPEGILLDVAYNIR